MPVVKNLPANAGDIRDAGSIPGSGRPPEEGNGNPSPHSSTLAWRVQWTEEPGGLHSMGSQRVGHDREWEHVPRNDGNGFDWGRLRK